MIVVRHILWLVWKNIAKINGVQKVATMYKAESKIFGKWHKVFGSINMNVDKVMSIRPLPKRAGLRGMYGIEGELVRQTFCL